MEDGEVRLRFDPLFPCLRHGGDPDGLVEPMQQAGFDLDDDTGRGLRNEAAFALAERLTGVRLTPRLLEESAYVCGVAPRSR